MIGRLAPPAKLEPAMPGFCISVSVIVAPWVASISRAVATVTGTKASSTTTIVPGGGGPLGGWGAVSVANSGAEADAVAGAGDGAAGCGAGFGFGVTGLGVVTTMAGNCV